MKEKILSALCTALGLEKADTAISQANCENWDSMRHLNLVVELESAFDVEFEPEEIAEMKCFEDIERILKQKM